MCISINTGGYDGEHARTQLLKGPVKNKINSLIGKNVHALSH